MDIGYAEALGSHEVGGQLWKSNRGLTFSLSGRWGNPGQNENEGGSHLQEGFQISKCIDINQGPAVTLGWRPEILAKPQRMIETTKREIPPFPEKGL